MTVSGYPDYSARALEDQLESLVAPGILTHWVWDANRHSHKLYRGETLVIELFSLKAVWIFLRGVRVTIEHYAE